MDTVIEKIIGTIVDEVGPDKIILFGSRARKEDKEQSDYDICVIKNGVDHRRKLAQKIYRSLYDVGASVDIIVETPERFDELKENRFMIYKEIATQGQVVYEK